MSRSARRGAMVTLQAPPIGLNVFTAINFEMLSDYLNSTQCPQDLWIKTLDGRILKTSKLLWSLNSSVVYESVYGCHKCSNDCCGQKRDKEEMVIPYSYHIVRAADNLLKNGMAEGLTESDIKELESHNKDVGLSRVVLTRLENPEEVASQEAMITLVRLTSGANGALTIPNLHRLPMARLIPFILPGLLPGLTLAPPPAPRTSTPRALQLLAPRAPHISRPHVRVNASLANNMYMNHALPEPRPRPRPFGFHNNLHMPQVHPTPRNDYNDNPMPGPSGLQNHGRHAQMEEDTTDTDSDSDSDSDMDDEMPGPYGMHNEMPGPSGMRNEMPGPYGMHNEMPGPSGMHNEMSGPYGMHNEMPGPSGMHNEMPGPSGMHDYSLPKRRRTEQDDENFGGDVSFQLNPNAVKTEQDSVADDAADVALDDHVDVDHGEIVIDGDVVVDGHVIIDGHVVIDGDFVVDSDVLDSDDDEGDDDDNDDEDDDNANAGVKRKFPHDFLLQEGKEGDGLVRLPDENFPNIVSFPETTFRINPGNSVFNGNVSAKQEPFPTSLEKACKASGRPKSEWPGYYSVINHDTQKSFFTCLFCQEKEFPRRTEATRHCRLHVPVETRRKVACPDCGRTFVSACNLRNHAPICTKKKVPIKCTICGDITYNRSAHNTHMTDVHGIKKGKYDCALCKKNFKKASDLKKHERNHYAKTKWPCSICGKTFKTITYIKKHKKKEHNVIEDPAEELERKRKYAELLREEELEKSLRNEGSTPKGNCSTLGRTPGASDDAGASMAARQLQIKEEKEEKPPIEVEEEIVGHEEMVGLTGGPLQHKIRAFFEERRQAERRKERAGKGSSMAWPQEHEPRSPSAGPSIAASHHMQVEEEERPAAGESAERMASLEGGGGRTLYSFKRQERQRQLQLVAEMTPMERQVLYAEKVQKAKERAEEARRKLEEKRMAEADDTQERVDIARLLLNLGERLVPGYAGSMEMRFGIPAAASSAGQMYAGAANAVAPPADAPTANAPSAGASTEAAPAAGASLQAPIPPLTPGAAASLITFSKLVAANRAASANFNNQLSNHHLAAFLANNSVITPPAATGDLSDDNVAVVPPFTSAIVPQHVHQPPTEPAEPDAAANTNPEDPSRDDAPAS